MADHKAAVDLVGMKGPNGTIAKAHREIAIAEQIGVDLSSTKRLIDWLILRNGNLTAELNSKPKS
jgi:hypothetical protein